MVEWLAGNRIKGTSTERTAGTAEVPAVVTQGGWKELARTTLGSASTTMDVTGLADKRYLMILANPIPVGSLASCLRVGNGSFDSGSNYAIRWSYNGGSDTRTGKNLMALDNINATDPQFHVGYIANKSNKEKLTIINSTSSTAGAGNAPNRVEQNHKWANTSDVIDQIQFLDDTSGTDINTGSEIVVLGWDEDDTHTTNFWEELASVDLSGGASDTVSSGTFTAKKYLMVEFFAEASGDINTDVTFNNDSSGTNGVSGNYSQRWSSDGGSDGTATSLTRFDMDTTRAVSTFHKLFIVNNQSNEKLVITQSVGNATAGAGTAPHRQELVAKWANTSDQITRIDMTNVQTGSYGTNSFLKVWGSD